MVITVLEARLEIARTADVVEAYAQISKQPRPAGLVRSQLVQGLNDPSVWQIQTVWESREALAAMRAAGTPAGVLVFRGAGAEPTLSMFEVVASID